MAQAFKKLHFSRDIELGAYLTPHSLSEALQMLADHNGKARVIAGGTDVVPELRKKDFQVEALVDISRLPDMSDISQDGGVISIGGLVTHGQAAASPLIQEQAGPLAQGCGSVGSPQIRNIATLAGNLVSGQPAADSSIPLMALEAEVTIASMDGERKVPLTEFFQSVGKTALDPSREILTRIQFNQMGPHQGGAYLRLSKRKALTLPMLVCAVVVTVSANKKTIERAAIALGPVAPTPFRERQAEEALAGAPVGREILSQVAESAAAYCSPRDSLLRGSCDYRQEMVKVFVRRGLAQALTQAGCTLD